MARYYWKIIYLKYTYTYGNVYLGRYTVLFM